MAVSETRWHNIRNYKEYSFSAFWPAPLKMLKIRSDGEIVAAAGSDVSQLKHQDAWRAGTVWNFWKQRLLSPHSPRSDLWMLGSVSTGSIYFLYKSCEARRWQRSKSSGQNSPSAMHSQHFQFKIIQPLEQHCFAGLINTSLHKLRFIFLKSSACEFKAFGGWQCASAWSVLLHQTPLWHRCLSNHLQQSLVLVLV